MQTNAQLNGPIIHMASDREGRRAPKRRTRWMPRAETVMCWSATAAPWGLAILLLAVSMPHLASGFQTICRSGPLAGWLLAIAIDSAQIVAKLGLSLKRYDVGPKARWTATGMIASTSVLSMALNVLAFLSGATDRTGVVLAWVAGVLLPLLVLALSYLGSCFALARVKRTPKAKTRK